MCNPYNNLFMMVMLLLVYMFVVGGIMAHRDKHERDDSERDSYKRHNMRKEGWS